MYVKACLRILGLDRLEDLDDAGLRYALRSAAEGYEAPRLDRLLEFVDPVSQTCEATRQVSDGKHDADIVAASHPKVPQSEVPPQASREPRRSAR